MSDRRMRALMAMANQSASPEEAAIARQKLIEHERRTDTREPCGICGLRANRHGPKPTDPVFVTLMGWHEYVPEWEVAWANYQEHQRIADELARQAEEREIAAMVRRWEHGTYRGMTVGGGATGPRLGKA